MRLVSVITGSVFWRGNSRTCHGLHVTLRWLSICAALTTALASCSKDDGGPFLSIATLCRERSVAICAARSFSCDEEQRDPNCQENERALCQDELEILDKDEEREYYAPMAAQVRSEEQAALDNDEPPFPVARYFDKGLAVGDECERDTQCDSGVCDSDTGVCSDPPETQLCATE